MGSAEAVIDLAKSIIVRGLVFNNSYREVIDVCNPVNQLYYHELDKCVAANSKARKATATLMDHAEAAHRHANICRQNIDLALVKGTVEQILFLKEYLEEEKK